MLVNQKLYVVRFDFDELFTLKKSHGTFFMHGIYKMVTFDLYQEQGLFLIVLKLLYHLVMT